MIIPIHVWRFPGAPAPLPWLYPLPAIVALGLWETITRRGQFGER